VKSIERSSLADREEKRMSPGGASSILRPKLLQVEHFSDITRRLQFSHQNISFLPGEKVFCMDNIWVNLEVFNSSSLYHATQASGFLGCIINRLGSGGGAFPIPVLKSDEL